MGFFNKKVIVNVPKGDINYDALRKFNGQIMTVSKICRVAYRNRSGSFTHGLYYELEGATSQYGIPYGFLGEYFQEVTS